MRKTLYFDQNGYCSLIDDNAVFQMNCEIPDGFDPRGCTIEEFVAKTEFKITDGHHIK